MSSSIPDDGQPREKRFSRLAILGTVCLPFGFLLILFFPTLNPVFDPLNTQFMQNAIRYLSFLVGIVAIIASTALGFLSMAEIRRSNGSIFGLPLAVFVSLFYPIVILTLILVIIGWTLLGQVSSSSLIPLAWLFVILLIDYTIIRYTWRAANR